MYALVNSGAYRGGVLKAPPSLPSAQRGRLLYESRRPCPCESRGLAGVSIPSWAWWLAGGLAAWWVVKK